MTSPGVKLEERFLSLRVSSPSRDGTSSPTLRLGSPTVQVQPPQRAPQPRLSFLWGERGPGDPFLRRCLTESKKFQLLTLRKLPAMTTFSDKQVYSRVDQRHSRSSVRNSNSSSGLRIPECGADILWRDSLYEVEDARSDVTVLRRFGNGSDRPNLILRIPGLRQVLHKDSFSYLLERFVPNCAIFSPREWRLPCDRIDFQVRLDADRNRSSGKKNQRWYIYKPSSGHGGEGVEVFCARPEDRSVWKRISESDNSGVIQEYLDIPHISHGNDRKWDLRVYVLIGPEIDGEQYVWMYHDALVRFASRDYVPLSSYTESRPPDLFTHLTNTSLNRFSSSQMYSNTTQATQSRSKLPEKKSSSGSGVLRTTPATSGPRTSKFTKRSSGSSGVAQQQGTGRADVKAEHMTTLKQSLRASSLWSDPHIRRDWATRVPEIVRCVVAALRTHMELARTLSGTPRSTVKGEKPVHFQHVIGLDLMWSKRDASDASFQPFLLEANSSPSMRIECEADEQVKGSVFRDLLELQHRLHTNLQEGMTTGDVGGWKRIRIGAQSAAVPSLTTSPKPRDSSSTIESLGAIDPYHNLLQIRSRDYLRWLEHGSIAITVAVAESLGLRTGAIPDAALETVTRTPKRPAKSDFGIYRGPSGVGAGGSLTLSQFRKWVRLVEKRRKDELSYAEPERTLTSPDIDMLYTRWTGPHDRQVSFWRLLEEYFDDFFGPSPEWGELEAESSCDSH